MLNTECEIVTALDIGSSKIFAIVAEIKEDKSVEIIGVAKTSSQGIRYGIIADIDKTVTAIKEVLAEAERMSGINIDSVLVSITGSHISSLNKKKVISISNKNHEITSEDIARVTDVNELILTPSDREVIHVLPSEFIVDGCRGIKSPLGMSGLILEAESHIVLGDKAAIRNLVKSVSQAGVKVRELVLQSLANAQAVLTESDRQLGVVLVDIGAGTTDISIYKDGVIKYTAVLDFGGQNINSALAKEIKISQSDAERLKINHGSAFREEISAISDIEFLTRDGKQRMIPEKKAAKIIEIRIREIFKVINKEIIKSGYKDLLAAGMVITGGEALLTDLTETASDILAMPARLGRPDKFNQLRSFFVGDNRIENEKEAVIYSTALGLLEYYANKQEFKTEVKESKEDKRTISLWSMLKAAVDSFF